MHSILLPKSSIESHSEQAPYYKFRVPYSSRMFSDICSYLEITKNSEVMDAGCGTGHLTEQLIDHAKHIYAVDGSKKMIKHAKIFQNVTYLISDLNQENFKLPNGVDHIFFGRSIHHFSPSSLELLVINNLKDNGSIITCSSEWFAEGGWGDTYFAIRKKFEEDESELKIDVTGKYNLSKIGFLPYKKFVSSFEAIVDTKYLARLTLARAYGRTLKNLLNNFVDFESELEKSLLSFSVNRKLKMIIRSWAYVYKPRKLN